MTNRAQLSQERSRRRREQLLKAALDVFMEGGSRAVTHRAVSARAGLPAATTTYYFESIEQLLNEALNKHFEHWDMLLREGTERTGPMTVDELLQFLAATVSQRPEMDARNEIAIYVEAAANPELSDAAERATNRFTEFVRSQVDRTGIPDAATLAEMLTLVLNGSAVQQASGAVKPEDETQRLIPIFRLITRAHLLGTGTADQTLLDWTEETNGRE